MLAEGVGPRTVANLLERLGDVERAVSASAEMLSMACGRNRGRALRAAIDRARPGTLFRRAEALGQTILTPADEAWPAAAFEALVDPPLALFLRGVLPAHRPPWVAVVGTRAAGHFGLAFARDLATTLGASGYPVVSGCALGIDGAAHAGALHAPGGTTVAVLGCGLDVSYPAEHAELKAGIEVRGALVSEHPPGTEPRAGFFPMRNRIVAALAEVVVVVEAPLRSGALITAQRALELGRDVLVVPGPAGRQGFRGGHHLIRQGEASICEGIRDVVETLGEETRPFAERRSLAPPEGGAPLAVWGVIGEDETVGQDALCTRTGLTASEVATALARLEIAGRVARVPGVGVRRT